MGEKIKRELTIIEGREKNAKMAKELVEAAIKAGFKVRWIKKFDESLVVDGKMDEAVTDMVLWRSPVDYSSAEVIERIQFWINQNRKVTLNTHTIGGRVYNSNKFFQHEMFLGNAVVRPCTLPCYPAISAEFILNKLVATGRISFPFVLKPNYGTRGEGIYLIRTEAELRNIQENFSKFSVEKFIESKYDWRVFVLGGVPLGIMKKLGNESDPADFISKSAGLNRFKEENVELAEKMMYIAAHASASCGLEYTGVDLIQDDKTGEIFVLETNVAGGWQNGFLNATGVDVPEKIMEWFLDRAEYFNEGKVRAAVEKYVERRLHLVSRAEQEKYYEIINFKYRPRLNFSEAEQILDGKDVDLRDKLIAGYLIVQGLMNEVTRAKVQALVDTVEKYEVSSFGNFIGKDCKVMEDAIVDTALYLAILSKL
jgi:prokaryotic glutathione synthetase, ATP-grasp domain